MLPTLTHYSRDPLLAVKSARQERGADMKPRGLWVSVDGNGDGWQDWCRDEMPDWAEAQKCVQTILPAANANILHLSTAIDIRRFHREFCASPTWSAPEQWIDWRRVAGKYDGIVIAPYCQIMRHDDEARWYYSWDCASGCIWRARAVKAVVPSCVLEAAE